MSGLYIKKGIAQILKSTISANQGLKKSKRKIFRKGLIFSYKKAGL